MLVLRLTPPTPQAPYFFFAGALPPHPVIAETQLPHKPKFEFSFPLIVCLPLAKAKHIPKPKKPRP